MIQNEGLKMKLEQLLSEYNTASIQVAMLKKGEVILSEAYGYRDYEQRIKADTETLYSIASITKSFTATALAKLVEEGKLEWDKPLIHYLPHLKMYDPYVTTALTMRDVLSHRSGLPRHDGVWYLNDYTTDELIDKIQYLKPSTTFRDRVQYNNIMYALAGHLLEVVSGEKWGVFIKETLLAPLGMTKTYLFRSECEHKENVARPYADFQGEIKRVEPYNYTENSTLSACGSMVSTAEDLLKWADFQINLGKRGSQTIIGEPFIKECQTPQMIDRSPELKLEAFEFSSYGLGWETAIFKGHKVVFHGGNIHGFSAMIAFVPKLDMGFCYLLNTEVSKLQLMLLCAFLEVLIEDSVSVMEEWSERFNLFFEASTQKKEEADRAFHQYFQKSNEPYVLSPYLGSYRNQAYGDFSVSENHGKLFYNSKLGEFELIHIKEDTFIMEATISAKSLSIPLTFSRDEWGHIEGCSIIFEPTLTEGIEFLKKETDDNGY